MTRATLTGWTVVALAVAAAGAVALVLARERLDDRASRGQRVGTATCLSCHEDRSGFARTAHHLTSRRAASTSIDGSFERDENVLRTASPSLHYRMDSTAAGFFQTAVIGDERTAGPRDARTRTARFDLVIGSGRKGQTYLSWTGDSTLVQLPVSFWKGAGWVPSPGYREGVPNFDRPVVPRCLECHASSFEPLARTPAANAYDPAAVVLGIGCETCHGAGAVHVERQRSWTRHVLGSGVIDPADLPRDRRVDVCGLCHGGAGRSRAAPFSYVPGDPLEAHLEQTPTPRDARVDVHGNQVALLRASRCFQRSDMTCGTCHDVHAPQRDASAFVARCLECHEVASCGLFPERGDAIAGGCVDCHMPTLPSATILSTLDGDTLRPRIRTHRIAVHDSLAPDAKGGERR